MKFDRNEEMNDLWRNELIWTEWDWCVTLDEETKSKNQKFIGTPEQLNSENTNQSIKWQQSTNTNIKQQNNKNLLF